MKNKAIGYIKRKIKLCIELKRGLKGEYGKHAEEARKGIEEELNILGYILTKVKTNY